jgi:hypothetical protein
MSTRCNIEICDDLGNGQSQVGCILYHHSDGYPSFQLPKLHRFLKDVFKRLKAIDRSYWWDSERVGAMMIFLSAFSYENPSLKPSTDPDNMTNGVPEYQPCIALHGDIEYIYRIILKGQGKYTIEIYDDCSEEDQRGKPLATVNPGGKYKEKN